MNKSNHPTRTSVLFDEIRWKDPLSGVDLEPIISARNPSGVPLCGVLRIEGTNQGYPIVDSVARLTPELANRHRGWLDRFGLAPPSPSRTTNRSFQDEETVDSFGFQWTWNSAMRSEADLEWRVATRYHMNAGEFAGKVTLDAGAGAGDQSHWLLKQGARVVSVDLSSAIDVVARKLRTHSNWVGVQGDITVLPFADNQFETVYCEGVIQHTRDSVLTVRELCRVVRQNGCLLATHYSKSTRLLGRLKRSLMGSLRQRLSKWDRYPLLLLTGILAALAYVPLLGRVLCWSGAAIRYDLMPDFKTTWTNTFDMYGNHTYQRHISPEEFLGYFEQVGGLERVFSDGTTVRMRKMEAQRGPVFKNARRNAETFAES